MRLRQTDDGCPPYLGIIHSNLRQNLTFTAVEMQLHIRLTWTIVPYIFLLYIFHTAPTSLPFLSQLKRLLQLLLVNIDQLHLS